MLNDLQNEESVERIEDVIIGVKMFSEMVALFFHLSEQNPAVPVVAANYMAQLIAKLVEWEVLTENQHQQLMFRLAEDAAERRAAFEKHQNGENHNETGDPTKDLIAQLGI